MNDGIEEPKTEELAPALDAEALPAEDPAAVPAREVPSWMRLAYAVEFLLALIAIVILWTEVGGQGHMDLLPWYSKLSCVLALAWCCVRFTAGMVEQPQIWNRRSIGWFVGIILVGITMAGITFFYHLHEVPDETDTEDTTSASVIVHKDVARALGLPRRDESRRGRHGVSAPHFLFHTSDRTSC